MYEIIERTSDFIVVYKYAGVDFHDSETGDGLFNTLKKELKISKLYPLHRLDKETSGLLILALTKNFATKAGELFRLKKIEKFYIAISDDKPKKRMGKIIGDMIRTRRKQWKLLRSKLNPAITEFVSKKSNGKTLFLIHPLSGKTHQIRVALKSISAPICGDTIYNTGNSKLYRRCYLHSYSLSLPIEGTIKIWKALPKDGDLFVYKNLESEIETLENKFIYKQPKVIPQKIN